MKKLMTVFLAAALVFAFAGQASATALETSGEIRARAWYLLNYIADDENMEMWDQRLRVNMDWPVAEGVKVHARADILEGVWGYTDGTTVDGGMPNVKTQQITFDHANLQFAVPGAPMPVNVTIGRQDVTWGTGFNAAADNRDRFKITAKLDPVSIGFMYDKNKETFLGHVNQDDARAYTVGVWGDASGFKYGGLLAYSIDETGAVLSEHAKEFVVLDGFVMGKAGPVDVKGEFVFATGKNGGLVPGTTDEKDLSGLGLYLGAFMPTGPVTLGLEGVYVSGDDPDTADKNEGGFSSDYQGPFWSVIFFNNMDYPGYAGSSTAADTQVSNAAGAKLSAVAVPVTGLTLIGNLLYASRLETGDGAEAMGFELDFIAMYNLTANVGLTAGIGTAFLGEHFEDAAGDTPSNPIGMVAGVKVNF